MPEGCDVTLKAGWRKGPNCIQKPLHSTHSTIGRSALQGPDISFYQVMEGDVRPGRILVQAPEAPVTCIVLDMRDNKAHIGSGPAAREEKSGEPGAHRWQARVMSS